MHFMKKKNGKFAINPAVMLICICSLLVIVLAVSVTTAKYSPEEELIIDNMNIQAIVAVENLNATSGFTYNDEGGQLLNLKLNNQSETTQAFHLVLLASLGFGNSAVVELELDGNSYIGVAYKITEDSDYYYSFGTGYIYRFYDQTTESEAIFTLTGNETEDYDINIKSANDGFIQVLVIA